MKIMPNYNNNPYQSQREQAFGMKNPVEQQAFLKNERYLRGQISEKVYNGLMRLFSDTKTTDIGVNLDTRTAATHMYAKTHGDFIHATMSCGNAKVEKDFTDGAFRTREGRLLSWLKSKRVINNLRKDAEKTN